MPANSSRRTVITAGLGLLTVVVAGCTKAVQARLSPSPAPTTAATSISPAATPASAAEVVPTAVPKPASTSAAPLSVHPHPTTSSTAGTHRVPVRTPTTRPSGPAGPAVQIAHGPGTRPNVALTFHGAGDIAYAREILKIARAKKAHLTVMAVGTWLSDNPAIGREILAGGHELGNHTLSHLDINSLSPEGMRTEVIGCRDILQRTTGSPGTYFRQSQSPTASDVLRQVVGTAGYRVCLSYDLDSMDWTDPGAQAVRDNLAAARPGSIVSMHLGHQGTVEALPGILDDLTTRGLRAVTVTTLLAG